MYLSVISTGKNGLTLRTHPAGRAAGALYTCPPQLADGNRVHTPAATAPVTACCPSHHHAVSGVLFSNKFCRQRLNKEKER